MPVTYLIKFQVMPERREQFLELLNGVLDAMRSEPMFYRTRIMFAFTGYGVEAQHLLVQYLLSTYSIMRVGLGLILRMSG